MIRSIEALASSHQMFASRVEKDVEQALRTFQSKAEMQNIHTISANLNSMAKELEDAQHAADKLNKKGGKANVQKVDSANTRLETATQEWESQAPFIFETLQALDEKRINHLRDSLTQLQTLEADQASRTRTSAEDVLNATLEVNTAEEIQNFAQRTISGRPKLEKRPTVTRTRQSSVVGGASTLAPPTANSQDDEVNDNAATKEGQPGKVYG
jgi:hypothetical protein